MMAPDDDQVSVSTTKTTASLTPSVASYMSSWSTPANVPPSRRRRCEGGEGGRLRGGRGHRMSDAASVEFHSRRRHRAAPSPPRGPDLERGISGGSQISQPQLEDGLPEAPCTGHSYTYMHRAPRPRQVLPFVLAFVSCIALFSGHPTPSYYRRLICNVVFDYSGFAGYSNWEDLVSTRKVLFRHKRSFDFACSLASSSE
jgi:hypothetical protein